MKKKHELLKYAYDNYPKDTKYSWGAIDGISSGKFEFTSFNDVYDVKTGILVYDSGGDHSEKGWAEIVKAKPFKQFKVGDKVKVISAECGCFGANGQTGTIVGDDTTITAGLSEDDDLDYKINIDGKIWGVKGEFEKVQFVMRSVDGVDLYEGDNSYVP